MFPEFLNQILISPHGENRRSFALESLGLLKKNAGNEVFIIAPHRGAADDLLYEHLRMGRSTFGVRRMSLFQLAVESASPLLVERRLAPVSSLAKEALIRRVVSGCRPLAFFERVADLPGFASTLSRTLEDLRAGRIKENHLARLGPRGEDLQRLLRAYSRELRDSALVDGVDLWHLAAEALLAGERDSPRHGVLLVDPPLRSRAIVEFLGPWLQRRPFALTLPLGDVESRRGLEAALEGVESVSWLTNPSAGTISWRERLFSEHQIDTDGASSEEFEFFSAPGEGRECAEIARRILQAVDEGQRFDEMAVLVRNPETYLPLLGESFGRAGIPFWSSKGVRRPDPAGRAFLALLYCAEEDYSANRFAEYLSFGQVPRPEPAKPAPLRIPWVEAKGDQMAFTSPEPLEDGQLFLVGENLEEDPVIGGSLRTPRYWERLLVDAGVIGGKERWTRRLRGYGLELEMRLEELSEEAPKTDHLRRELTFLRYLEDFSLPVIEALSQLPGGAEWGSWIEGLESLAVRVLRSPATVLSVLAELRPMESVGPVGIEEVRRVLADRLRTLRTESPDKRNGKVFFGELEEARGRLFNWVFLPGLAEGVFPRKSLEDPLMADEERSLLPSGLTMLPDRVERERLLLRLGVGAARHRVLASYPRLDLARGRARVPSFYAFDLLRAVWGQLPDVGDIERMAAASSSFRLGWSAPQVAADAIDAQEFDIAFLASSLAESGSVTDGRARYLLEVNPNLKRHLEVRGRRWRNFYSGADGLVDPSLTVLHFLAEQSIKSRSYSPTALQHWSACPYRFYLYAILRLRPREEPQALEEIDPLTRGRLIHEIQYEFYSSIERDHLHFVAENTEELNRRLDATIEEVALRYQEDLAPSISRVWWESLDEIRIDLKGWLRYQVDSARDYKPRHFELSFGLGEDRLQDTNSRAEPVRLEEGFQLRGSIDLVEESVEGRFRVTDHKTGRALKSSNLVIGKGRVLQPTLYALAAESLLDRFVESGRLFYCTRRGSYAAIEVPFDSSSRTRALEVLRSIDHGILTGFLPAAPTEDACQFCDYRPVCGPYEVLRDGMKRPDSRLENLRGIRQCP